MKTSLLFGLLLSSVFVLPAFADEIKSDTRLTAATVYTGHATLTREAVVDVPAGSHTLVFENLSADLMPDSLRAEGVSGTKVTFGALSHRMVASAELIAPREKELNEQLIALQDQRNKVEGEKKALSAKQLFLENLGKAAALRAQENIAAIDLKPDQWAAAGKTILTETSDTLKSLVDQDIALRSLDEQIRKIQTDLTQLQTGQRNTYTVTLPLETTSAGHLTVKLSYQIPGASWSPLYDARLDTKTGKVDLVQYGSVKQSSGEDWTGISLTLSTAQPQRGTGLPELPPLWLSLYDPQMYETRRMNEGLSVQGSIAADAMKARPGMPAAPQAVNTMMAQEKVEAEFQTATIDTGGFVSEYRIPGPSEVKADGTESKLMIGSFDSDSKMGVQIKPQISTDAYLVATSTLKGEAPILPGLVNLFRDGAYVGQSSLPLLRPGEEQELAFGVDDQVSVKRKIMKDEHSKAGVINRDNITERHLLTEIQNLHTQPVEVTLLETIPVAQDKQIRVELLEDQTTSGYKSDVHNVKGLLGWTLNLTPKEKSDVKLGWKVSWPTDKTLSGL